MERKLNSPAPSVLIHPASKGWHACFSGTVPAVPGARFDTLEELAASLPSQSVVKIALPVSMVVVERMTLPALDREELRGIVHLQLEKSLPFPVEDVTCDFQVIKQTESESSLLAMAINNEQFNSLCQPLRDRALLPQRATFFAMHVGRLSAPDQTSLFLYRENEKVVLSIYEKTKLTFIQLLPSASIPELMSEIPAILFGAELDGVATDFPGICLDRNLVEMESALVELLALPVKLISTDQVPEDEECDLLPPSFLRERKQRDQTARIKSNLVTAAIVYLMLLAAGFACLIWLQHRVTKVDNRIAALQPDIDFVKTRVSRWNALAPAIERDRFVVELLYQVCTSLPSDGIRITSFEVSKDQFMVEGEAPTAALAIEFGDQLKQNAALQAYRFEIGPPTLLANEHAQMRIFGKL